MSVIGRAYRFLGYRDDTGRDEAPFVPGQIVVCCKEEGEDAYLCLGLDGELKAVPEEVGMVWREEVAPLAPLELVRQIGRQHRH